MSYLLFMDESGHDRVVSPREVLAGVAIDQRRAFGRGLKEKRQCRLSPSKASTCDSRTAWLELLAPGGSANLTPSCKSKGRIGLGGRGVRHIEGVIAANLKERSLGE